MPETEIFNRTQLVETPYMKPAEESKANTIKGILIDHKDFLIRHARKIDDMKEVKKVSKAIDQIDKVMDMLE